MLPNFYSGKWFYERPKTKLNSLDHSGRMFAGVLLSVGLLIKEGDSLRNKKKQSNLPSAVSRFVREFVLMVRTKWMLMPNFSVAIQIYSREFLSYVQNF